jgi:hypothetical protein
MENKYQGNELPMYLGLKVKTWKNAPSYMHVCMDVCMCVQTNKDGNDLKSKQKGKKVISLLAV